MILTQHKICLTSPQRGAVIQDQAYTHSPRLIGPPIPSSKQMNISKTIIKLCKKKKSQIML